MTSAEILARLEWDEDGLPRGWPQGQAVASAGPAILAWSETVLTQPDRDGAGEPWCWRESQARFVAWWYALDEDGRYLWRRGQIVLPKGAGKSPMAAALACVELAGPVRFAEWAEDGQPVMRPHSSPDVKLSALSQDQAEDATMGLAISMLENPAAMSEIPGLDVALTRVRTRNGKLSSSTARAPSKEGLRPTAVVLDEAHLWIQANGGHRLAETLRRGVAKTGGRSLETTNQWQSGQDSVAEQTAIYADAVRAGTHSGDGVLTWHPIGVCDDLGDPVQLRAALEALYWDSPWIDIDRLAAEVLDGDTHPADARRYYLNQPASADDAWIRADLWHACLDRAKPLAEGDTITLGFDGSRGRARGNADATALVAVRVKDGHVELLGCWQAREGEDDWQAPEALIDAAVRDAFKRFRVVGFYADPSGWQSQLGTWEQQFSRRLKVRASNDHPTHYWANRTSIMVKALAAFEEAVNNGDLSHDGSYRLTEHILNSRRTVSRGGVQIAKEYPDSPRKIDCAVAATLAWAARLDALSAAFQKHPTGKGRIIVLQ
ncbi:MAG TPA: terminase [Candidatus Dormibacteraeota bacterium]|nr:terminase [Candidatus Dormibacteraeota bacterium]